MKKTTKEFEYSLLELINYNEILDYRQTEVLKKYILIINEYLKFILETTKIKNSSYFKFIIIRGYDTITNVFNNILYHTKNLDVTFYHCQKAYYYYVEFIEQIRDEQHIFLQLTSRDASTYVYKKIFSELVQNTKNDMVHSNEFKKYMTIIDKHILIFNNIFVFTVENLVANEENLITIKNNYFKTICEKIINLNLKIKDCETIYTLVEKANNSFCRGNENVNENDNVSNKNILSNYHKLVANILTKHIRYKSDTPLL